MFSPVRFSVIFVFLNGISANKVRYDNHRLYRVNLETEQHAKVLREIESDILVDHMDNETHFLVPPHKDTEFNNLLKKRRITRATIMYDNIQKKIDEEANNNVKPVNVSVEEFGWENFYHLETIYAWLDHLAEKYNGIVTVLEVGNSYENVTLKGVKISYKSNKDIVFVEGGIHAKEWISTATSTFILNQLLSSNDSQVRDIAENFDWIFVPCVNPDGYKYTFEKDRLWRKSRKPYGNCYGVDLNRNWDFEWHKIEEDDEPCGNNYPGPYAFSEPEILDLSNFLKSQNIQTYFSLHAPSQKLLYPYAGLKQNVSNRNDLETIAKKATEKIKQRYGTVYVYGNAYETIYPAPGTAMDYAYAKLGVPIVYTLELRSKIDRFLLPANQIIPNCEETLDAFVIIINEARNLGYYHNNSHRVNHSYSAYWLSLAVTGLFIFSFVIFYVCFQFVRRNRSVENSITMDALNTQNV